MGNSRRSFLKVAGITALGIGTKPVLDVFAASGGHGAEPKPEVSQNEEVLTAKRWGMVIDTRKFHSAEDLDPIIEACHKIHNVPELTEPRHKIMWLWGMSINMSLLTGNMN
jgi:molybdopterin-containing oxidoreductase family iron-sulfur binding subunit